LAYVIHPAKSQLVIQLVNVNFTYVIYPSDIWVNAIELVNILKSTYLNEPSLFKNSHGSSLGKNNVAIGIDPGVLI
jgi:hypothetical protein